MQILVDLFHFMIIFDIFIIESEVAQSCPTLGDPMDCSPPGSSIGPWDFPGKSTGVGCHFLFQGIFLTQGSNPGLPHCRQMLLLSEPPGKSYYRKHTCEYTRSHISDSCSHSETGPGPGQKLPGV